MNDDFGPSELRGYLPPRAAALHLRSRILQTVRNYFVQEGYLEVDTPLRVPTLAPEPYILPQPAGDWFLQTSPELCMKRLLASGYQRIFQICKCFRRQERGRNHLPEFTMLEWYTAHQNYQALMQQCEELIVFVATAVKCLPILWQHTRISLERPWPRLAVAEAFARYGRLTMEEALRQNAFDEIMALDIEPRLGHSQPVFLYDYPLASGALARPRADQPHLVERFELYIGGLELCNACSELTDEKEQVRRFQEALDIQQQQGETPLPWPERFIDALPQLPPSAGSALGLDRLVMLLSNHSSIDDVAAFTPEEL